MKSQPDQTELNRLIDLCWEHHAWVKENYPDILPPKEIPILWFGNLEKYFESDRKIVTVGLNPSEMEFRLGDTKRTMGDWSMRRFQKAKELTSLACLRNDSDRQRYRAALNEYFLNASLRGKKGKKKTAYMKWFSNWNGILHSLDASFDPEEKNNAAIHTDFCTPIATTPNWGDITDEKKKQAIVDHAASLGLWKRFVTALEPHVILTCISSQLVDDIVDSLELIIDDNHSGAKVLCSRSPARKTIHAFRNTGTASLHLFAAPAGSPWKGWYKCQVEDFAKQIAEASWPH